MRLFGKSADRFTLVPYRAYLIRGTVSLALVSGRAKSLVWWLLLSICGIHDAASISLNSLPYYPHPNFQVAIVQANAKNALAVFLSC